MTSLQRNQVVLDRRGVTDGQPTPQAILSAPPAEAPRPFLKWAGGKRSLLGHISPRLPDRIRTYYEPFVGGGAVFFHLAAHHRFERAILGDLNPELIEAYVVVRDDCPALVEALIAHAAFAEDAAYYYEVRAWPSLEERTAVERAARLIFLNKTCFNGLYRVNKRGQFNVPFGHRKRPWLVDTEGLLAASNALRGVELIAGDFAATVRLAGKGDAVYLDPPYVPRSSTASFTAYHQAGFGSADHERLPAVLRCCAARGAVAVLSNADTATTRALFEGFSIHEVMARRAINRVGGRRGPVGELLVTARPNPIAEHDDHGAMPQEVRGAIR